jgi:hypothetical protein
LALDEYWGFKLVILAASGCDGVEPIKSRGVKLAACYPYFILNCIPTPITPSQRRLDYSEEEKLAFLGGQAVSQRFGIPGIVRNGVIVSQPAEPST